MNRISTIRTLFCCFLMFSLAALGYSQGIEDVFVETYYVSDASDATDTFGGGLPAGSKTYRVYVDMAPGWELETIFGTTAHPSNLTTTTYFWNNEDRGETSGHALNGGRINNNTVALDSYLAFGKASSDHIGILKSEDTPGSLIAGAANDGGSAAVLGGLLVNDHPDMCGEPLTATDGLVVGTNGGFQLVGDPLFLSEVSQLFGDAISGSEIGESLAFDNSAWAVLGGSPGFGAGNRILIAQVTTTGDFSFELSMRLKGPGGIGSENYVPSNPQADPGSIDDVEKVFAGLSFSSVGYSSCPAVLGCIDPAACNFNAAATEDDGSCLLATGCDECAGNANDGTGTLTDNPEVGESCDDGDANTINDIVGEDCGCAGEPIVTGCDDLSACNYNENANVVDNTTCLFATGCDECAGNATDGTGTVTDNPEVGESCDDGDANTINDIVGEDCGCAGEPIVTGCDDLSACNYNENANVIDNTTCLFATGCDECAGNATDGTGTVTDNPEVGEACDDGDANTTNDTIQENCACAGEGVIIGCTELEACNYNANANVADNATCLFATGCDECAGNSTDGTGTVTDNPEIGESCDDGDANTVNDIVGADCGCAGEPAIIGCDDITACNYNENTNVVDNTSCLFATGCDECAGNATDGTGTVTDNPEVGESCDDGDANTINDIVGGDCGCAGETAIVGCDDITACNYNENVNVIDNTTCLFANGCDECAGNATDGTGTVIDNPEVGESCDDGDANTINDTIGEGCECLGITAVVGCGDINACNYNDDANVIDNSLCLFATGCDECAGNSDDGTGTVTDNPEVGESCDDGDANTINDIVGEDCACAGEVIVEGCTNPLAINFNPLANVDDNSCEFGENPCDAASSIGVIEFGPITFFTDGDLANGVSAPSCDEDADAVVYYSFVAESANDMIYAGTQGAESQGFDAIVEVFDGCPGASLGCYDFSGPDQLERIIVGGLVPGTTYYYSVTHSGDASVLSSTAFKTSVETFADHGLSAGSCDILDYELGDFITATPDFGTNIYNLTAVQVNGYAYQFSQGGQVIATIFRDNPQGYNLTLSSVAGLTPGQVYDVSTAHKVKTSHNGIFGNSVWGPFGETCQIGISTVVPNVRLRDQYCGGDYTYPSSTNILSTTTPGATSYQWRLENLFTEETFEYTTDNYSLLLSNFGAPGLTDGLYSVSVRAGINGVFGDYGFACDISINVGGIEVQPFEEEDMAITFKQGVNVFSSEIDMTIFPNPNTGEQLRLEISGLNDQAQTILVSVIDINGKLIHSERYSHEGERSSRLVDFNNKLTPGMYFVTIQADERISVQKMMVK